MRRWAFGLVALAAVAAAVVAFWPRGGGAPKGGEGASGGGDGSGDVPAGISGGDEAALGGGPGLAAGTGPSHTAGRVEPRKGRSTIEGVVRRDGKPCAATVELRQIEKRRFYWGADSALESIGTVPAIPAPVATDTAGANGRFAFHGWGEAAYVVRASTVDGASGSAEASVEVDGARVEANVDLSPSGGVFAGRVVYVDGSPWTGTVVVASPDDAWTVRFGRGMPAAVEVTDAAGTFRAAGLAAGTWRAFAVVPGVAALSGRDVTLPQKSEYVLTVNASVRRVEGRVLDDVTGQGIGGATVAVVSEGSREALGVARGTSATDGSFRIDVDATNSAALSITAAAEGYAHEKLRPEGKESPIEVRMKRAASVEGRVLSAVDGTPISGAKVTAMEGQSWFGSGEATSGADGRYSISPLPEGEIRVRATAPGWVVESPDASDGPTTAGGPTHTLEAGKTATVDIRMVKGARVVGRVLDDKGAPLTGAVVSAERVEDRSSPFWRWLGSVGDDGAGSAVATGEDGAFAMDTLPVDRAYRFRAAAPGFCEAISAETKTRAETPVEVEIRFGPPRSLDVTVLDEATGAPIANADVSASARQDRLTFERDTERFAKTGTDGHARLDALSAAVLMLDVSAPEYVSQSGVAVAEGESSVTVRLKRGRSISGRVVRPDGTPAAGAEVSVDHSSHDSWVESVDTDADGAFRVSGIADGECTVEAEATIDGRQASASATVAAGAEGVVLALEFEDAPKKGRINVRVLDPDGKPVAEASVRAQGRGGSSTTHLSDGRASIDVQGSEGTWAIEVSGARGRGSPPALFGPARVEGVRPGGDEVTIRLPPEMTITGVVVDESGNPVAGAVVRATPGEPDARDRAFRRDDLEDMLPFDISGVGAGRNPKTRADGAFRVGGLGPGPHTLRVRAPADYAKPDPIRAVSGATGVSIVLKKGAPVTVRVLGPDGRPVGGAIVSTRAASTDTANPVFRRVPRGFSFPWARATDSDGKIRLTGLDSAREYALDVAPPEDRDDLLSKTIDRWTPHDDTVRLEAGWTLKGVVRDRSGKPVPRAYVQRRGPTGSWDMAGFADNEGRFTIPDLPLASAVLRASVRWMAPGAPGGEEVTASPGGGEVVLVVDPGATLTVVVDGWPKDAHGYVSVRAGQGPAAGGSRMSISVGGTTQFTGLDPNATYTVFVKPQDSDLYGLKEGVRPSSEPVRVGLVAGRSLRVAVRAPAGADEISVRAMVHGAMVSGERTSDGAFVIRGLPEGAWRTSAHATVGDVDWSAEAKDVATGATADLELKPEDE